MGAVSRSGQTGHLLRRSQAVGRLCGGWRDVMPRRCMRQAPPCPCVQPDVPRYRKGGSADAGGRVGLVRCGSVCATGWCAPSTALQGRQRWHERAGLPAAAGLPRVSAGRSWRGASGLALPRPTLFC